jgi:hypothetical protein
MLVPLAMFLFICFLLYYQRENDRAKRRADALGFDQGDSEGKPTRLGYRMRPKRDRKAPLPTDPPAPSDWDTVKVVAGPPPVTLPDGTFRIKEKEGETPEV